jgi:hypothetical protein
LSITAFALGFLLPEHTDAGQGTSVAYSHAFHNGRSDSSE